MIARETRYMAIKRLIQEYTKEHTKSPEGCPCRADQRRYLHRGRRTDAPVWRPAAGDDLRPQSQGMRLAY